MGKRIENFKHGIDRNPKSINKQAKKNENANINENIGDYLEKRNELNPVRAALEKVKNFGDSIHLSKYPINTSDIGGKSDNLAGYAARLGNIQAVKILEEYKIHLEEGVVYNNNQSAQSIGKPDKVQNNKVQKMFGKVSRALSTMMSLGGSAPNAPNASEKSEKKKLR